MMGPAVEAESGEEVEGAAAAAGGCRWMCTDWAG